MSHSQHFQTYPLTLTNIGGNSHQVNHPDAASCRKYLSDSCETL